MKPLLHYGNEVLVLPGQVMKSLPDTTEIQLKVLLALASESVSSAKDPVTMMAGLLGCPAADVSQAISYWQELGILEGTVSTGCLTDSSQAPSNAGAVGPVSQAGNIPARTTARKPDELPNYTSDEVIKILDTRKEISGLIDACQQTWGKMFNTFEINKILAMVDYLNLSGDFVLELIAYCSQAHYKSISAVEKMAFKLAEEGITTSDALQQKLRSLREQKEWEYQVRKIFGVGDRDLTTKETGMITKWSGFGYGTDIVRMAYEVTCDATGKPSIPYANAILEKWHKEGYSTCEEIERAQQSRKEQNTKGSFDDDEFFEAALNRSYGKDYNELANQQTHTEN